MRLKIAILLARLAHVIHNRVNFSVEPAEDKELTKLQANAAILAQVIYTECNERSDLVRQFSRYEVDHVLLRARQLYDSGSNENGQEIVAVLGVDFDSLTLDTKSWYIDRAISEYLDEKIKPEAR